MCFPSFICYQKLCVLLLAAHLYSQIFAFAAKTQHLSGYHPCTCSNFCWHIFLPFVHWHRQAEYTEACMQSAAWQLTQPYVHTYAGENTSQSYFSWNGICSGETPNPRNAPAATVQTRCSHLVLGSGCLGWLNGTKLSSEFSWCEQAVLLHLHHWADQLYLKKCKKKLKNECVHAVLPAAWQQQLICGHGEGKQHWRVSGKEENKTLRWIIFHEFLQRWWVVWT